MLSQERVIALLYEKTFPMTSTEMQNGDDIDDMQELERQQQMQMQHERMMEENDGVEIDEEEEDMDPMTHGQTDYGNEHIEAEAIQLAMQQ